MRQALDFALQLRDAEVVTVAGMAIIVAATVAFYVLMRRRARAMREAAGTARQAASGPMGGDPAEPTTVKEGAS